MNLQHFDGVIRLFLGLDAFSASYHIQYLVHKIAYLVVCVTKCIMNRLSDIVQCGQAELIKYWI